MIDMNKGNLNKLVTNYPVELTPEEVENLSQTLSSVRTAREDDKTYTGEGFVNVNNTNNVISLTNEANEKLNQPIPTKVSDLTDSASYQTVSGMDEYLTKTSASENLAPLSITDDIESLKNASSDWNKVSAKLDTTAFSTVSGNYAFKNDLNDYYQKTETSSKGELDIAFESKQDKLIFGYDENNAISSINNTTLAGQDVTTYSAGQYIEIDENNTISVTGLLPLNEYAQYEPVLIGDSNITATSSKVDSHTQWNLAINSKPVITDTKLVGENSITAHTTNVSGEWVVGLEESAHNAIASVDGIATDVGTLKTSSAGWDKVSAKLDVTSFSTVSGTFLTEIPDTYATKNDLNIASSTLTSIDNDLSGHIDYVSAHSITSLDDYYTKTQVDSTFALKTEIPTTVTQLTDSGNYYQKTETSSKTEITNALNTKVDNPSQQTGLLVYDGDISAWVSMPPDTTIVQGQGSITSNYESNSTYTVSLLASAENALKKVVNKIDTTAVEQKYQTKDDMSNYLTTSEASTTYQPIGDYATTSDISDMATQTWVGQQGFYTKASADNDYAPKTITATLNTLTGASAGWNEVSAISRIDSVLANKKDKQTELNFNGSATKTVTNISQDANGEITVTYEDIDLPSQVPNVEITSEDSSVNITSSVDAGTNTKTFDLSVNDSGSSSYTAGNGIDITNNDTISVKYGKGLEITTDNRLQLKVGKGLTLDNDTLDLSIKDLATSITSFRTGDVIPVDGPSGTAKMSKDDLLKVTAENALGSIKYLSNMATEDDLISGSYLAIDGIVTKKLPCDCVAPKSTTETIDKAADLKNAIFGISRTLSSEKSGHIALAFPICKGVTYRITPSVNVGACYALDDNDAGESHRLEMITEGIYETQYYDYTAGVNADYVSVYFSAAGSVKIESIGVSNLIEENAEIAQLGFEQTITAVKRGWVITQIKGYKAHDYILSCNVDQGVSIVASIDNAKDASASHRIETFTNNLPNGNALTFKPSTSFDYLAIFFANAGTCTLKLKYGVKELYDRVEVVENNFSFLNKNMKGGVEIPSGSINGISVYGVDKISIKEGRTYSLGLIPSADITNSNYITMKLSRMSDNSTYVQVSAWMTDDYPKLLAGNFYFFNFTATEDVDDLKIGSYFNSASVDSAMTIQYYLTDVTELVASSGAGENATNAGVYYKSKLKVEIENLKKDSDVVFAFVSDLHYAKKALQRVVDVAESLGLDAIINGGDTVNNLNTEGLGWMNDIAAASSVPLLSVLGNHDCWESSSPWVWSTAEANYNLFMPELISVAGVVVPSDASTAYKSYWYKDFGGLRIIGIDGIDFDMADAHHFDAAQLSWFESVLNDARTNSKAVIVVNHYPFPKNTSSKKSVLWNSWNTYLDGYKSWDNLYTPDSALNAVKSFIDAGGTFVVWLAGHQHVDYNITNSIDPRQVMHGIASGAGNKHGSDGVGSLSIEDSRYDCFDLIGVDLTHGFVKFLRCGYDFDACMQKRDAVTWDFVNLRVLGGI